MPVYDFVCEDCGPFEEQRSFARSGDPASCSGCEKEARRVYSMPSFTSISKAQKELRRREENSGEPKLGVRPKSEGPPAPPKLHRGGGRPWEIGH